MKKIFTVLSAALLSASLWAQAPQKFSYQAVIRNASNSLIANKSVGMKISLLQGSETGNAVYVETHSPTSNANGLVSIAIGGGTVVSGTFVTIDWANGSYFVKTETDPTGGTSYSLTTTSQLLSVPYALFSANGTPGPAGAQGLQGLVGPQGPIGPIGPAGVAGPNGTPGLAGAQGLQGLAGPQGPIGLTGPAGVAGPNGTPGIAGAQGLQGLVGPQGPIGLTGPAGVAGPAGVSGLPSGGTNGQGLTICDGLPTWTTGGICPGKVLTIDCSNATNNGTLTAAASASNINSVISYTGGNGGPHIGQTVTSTGVTGLIATLSLGTFTNGNGSLTYTITGTPSAGGTASFAINIGGMTCTLNRTVIQTTSGYGLDLADNDGNTYKTVYVGSQQWMAENLKVSKYNDGSAIPNVTDNTQWQNTTTGAWAYYNNDLANNAKYGKLYNWYALSPTTNGNKNVCPTGWHVPTDAEWTVLTNYLGGATVAGGKMKEVGTTSWNSPNTDATNTSLFTGLPGGSRTSSGSYTDGTIGNSGYWWSSTEVSTTNAWYRGIGTNFGLLYRDNFYFKNFGLSVRCLKD